MPPIHDEDLAALESRLGARFRRPNLLRLALTHKSVANESAQPVPHNERLEFLGDAVLGATVAAHLYRAFPDAPEGALTVMRARLVRRSTLAEWARSLGLGNHLVLGRGAGRAGARDRETVLAAAFEAVVGAIFLDRGQRAAEALVRPFVERALPSLSESPQSEDAKSALQRRLQTAIGRTPRYRLLAVEGPEHEPYFTVEVEALPGLVAQGSARTKQAAEQAAAERVLAAWAVESLYSYGEDSE